MGDLKWRITAAVKILCHVSFSFKEFRKIHSCMFLKFMPMNMPCLWTLVTIFVLCITYAQGVGTIGTDNGARENGRRRVAELGNKPSRYKEMRLRLRKEWEKRK